jgi:hypothetical protein
MLTTRSGFHISRAVTGHGVRFIVYVKVADVEPVTEYTSLETLASGPSPAKAPG